MKPIAGEKGSRVVPTHCSTRDNAAAGLQLRIECICSIPSIANNRMHWVKLHTLFKTQRFLVCSEWSRAKPEITLPCTVTLTRISMFSLDDDNLSYSMKGIRDAVADKLLPGLAKGRADGDKRIDWRYAQEKGKIQKLRIEIS